MHGRSLTSTYTTYDALGRPILVADALGQTTLYTYTSVGQRIHLTYPDGKVVTSTYNGDYRLIMVEDWHSEQTSYAYDEIGRLITTTLPNGVLAVNGYDDNGRLTNLRYTLTETVLAEFAYELDPVGNRMTATETIYNPALVETIEQYLEQNGLLVIEAEQRETAEGETHQWQAQTNQAGFVGTGYLRALPDLGQLYEANDEHAPTASYRFQIENTASYAQLQAPTRVLGPDFVVRYIEDGADHFAHAENYCTAASLRSKAVLW